MLICAFSSNIRVKAVTQDFAKNPYRYVGFVWENCPFSENAVTYSTMIRSSRNRIFAVTAGSTQFVR
jgi:hypothetical protein